MGGQTDADGQTTFRDNNALWENDALCKSDAKIIKKLWAAAVGPNILDRNKKDNSMQPHETETVLGLGLGLMGNHIRNPESIVCIRIPNSYTDYRLLCH